MDLQQLSTLFTLTLNPDPNIRKKAELDIRKIGNEDGLVTALLQVIATDSVDIATRQSAAVWVKNRVFTHYPAEGKTNGPFVSPADCASLRANLLRLIANAPSRPIALQLANAFKNVLVRDFPAKWPTLLDDIKALLASGDIREVHAGCLAALEAVRGFRYHTDQKKLHVIVNHLFPTLVGIATNMMHTPPTASEDIPSMLHLILKTYRTSTATSLSPHQRSAESLVPWGQLLFAVVNLHIPPEAVPADEEERESSEWWKTKKWAYANLGRLFHRFGNPSQLPTAMKDYKDFAEHFVNVFAPEILNIYLHQVEIFVSGQAWLSQKCQYHIFTFFNECIKPKSTWVLLKPHFSTLVSTFVFPQLSFSPARQALWEADAVDYVRLSVDEYENYATPVSAATTFLFSLVSNRTNATFEPILAFVNSVLQGSPRDEDRFGALNMLAALGPWMMKHPKVKDSMGGLVRTYVAPVLTSDKAYLRAISCELIGTLVKNKMQFENEADLHTISTQIFALLDDPEYPVKVQACLALTELITAFEYVAKAVAPQVAKVIQDVLRLSDESELDILNHSMEMLVDTYQTELLPVAAQLAQRLCDSYLRLAREAIAQDEHSEGMDLETMMSSGDDDKTFLAMGIAKTIWTVVASVDSSPQILNEVQEVVIPIIVFTLENKFLDLFDNMYDLVDSLTFKLRSISPSMWKVFELTHSLFKSDAVDYLEEMLPSLDNFVSFGADVIKQRPEYKQMLVDIFTTSITNEHLGENDRVNGCKLAESILLNLKGHVDEALLPIMQTVFAHIDEAQTAALKLGMLEVLINCVLYNPSAALHLMESTAPGNARRFFDKWFEAIRGEGKLPRVHDKRLSIVTLAKLLEMDPASIPDTVKDGWPGLLAGALKLFKEYPAAVKARKDIEESMQDDDEDDEPADEKYLNLTNDDGDVWDEDSAYLEMLANEGARLREKSTKTSEIDEDFEDLDEDDEDDDDIEEELGYYSVLDSINPYQVFQQALAAFQVQNSAAYQAAATSLTLDEQTFLMEVLKIAENSPSAVP